MTNYAILIEEELRALEERARKLAIALEIVRELRGREIVNIENRENAKLRIEKLPSNEKPKRKKFGTNMYARTKDATLNVLRSANGPMRARELIDGIRATMEVSDTTVWKVTKDLRDLGVITWDTETRQYAMVENLAKPMEKKAS